MTAVACCVAALARGYLTPRARARAGSGRSRAALGEQTTKTAHLRGYSDSGKMSNFSEFKGSAIWEHFLRGEAGQKAKCRYCNKVLKITGGSTKGLHVHLKSYHPNQCAGPSRAGGSQDETNVDQPQPASKKTKTIDSYFLSKTEDDLDSTLARLCGRDGIPFNVFCTSLDLRSLMAAKGFRNLPTHIDSIRKRVMRHCARLKCQVKQQLTDGIAKGTRFSLTIDEYTSLRNRRYMSVTVHSGEQVWGLGVVRCRGSMPAEKCLEVLKVKLAEFDLDLHAHVACVTTDGASVMVKFGKSLPCEHQLCLAHGVHLAVTDVLYSRQRGDKATTTSDANTESSTDEGSDGDDDGDDEVSESELRAQLHGSRAEAVQSVRKIVRWFRKSPVRNEVLQKYVSEEHGKEMILILDCKTRWNSLFAMLERFMMLKGAVHKAMIDIGDKNVDMISDRESDLLQDIVRCLNIVKLGAEALCRRDTGLLEAEAAVKFMLGALKKEGSQLAKAFCDALTLRMRQRRSKAAAVLQTIHKDLLPQDDEWEQTFPQATRKEVHDYIRSMIERMGGEGIGAVTVSESDSDVEPEAAPEQTLQQQLQQALETAARSRVPDAPGCLVRHELSKVVKKELENLPISGKGQMTTMAYKWLKGIVATSVESERVFSTVGNIVTKLRSRLGDDAVDALCFLKGYYTRK